MSRRRKPAVLRPRWRCIICAGVDAPWIYADEAFAEWQVHYIREHMGKP